MSTTAETGRAGERAAAEYLRRAGSLTPPEAAVTPQKFRALTRAAVRYLAATGGQEEAQFDLAAVDVMPDGHMEVRLVEQAMEYNW